MIQISFDPLVPLALWAALAAALVGLLGWYAVATRTRLPRGRRPAVILLMGMGAAVPLLILLNPTWHQRIPPPAGKPLLTILVDRSASMATTDAEEGRSRYQQATRLATRAATQLADQFEIRLRTFAAGWSASSVEQLPRQSADGAVTDLAAAVEDALEASRPQGQAVMLLSDGIHNAGSTAQLRQSVAKARAMAVPVYVHTLGGQRGVRDLSLRLHRSRELAFVGQRTPMVVRLEQRGALGSQARLTLLLNDEAVEQRDVELRSGQAVEAVFDLQQSACGLYRYEIRAEPLPGEVTPLNNYATFLLRVVDEPVRVLLLEGKPYWDTKFLLRTLATDPSIDLTSVVQLSEGRFIERRVSPSPVDPEAERAKGIAGEPANQTPRSDHWTIHTQPTTPLDNLGQLAAYQVLLLGRDADVFLNELTLPNLEKWLKQYEASLICFRGPPSSQINQRLARLMPVRWTPSRETRFRVRLTEPGQSLRWFPMDTAPLAGLPSLAAVAEPQPRPLAETVVESVAPSDEGGDPVITFARVGMGRVVVVEGAGMWRWAMLPPQYRQHDGTYVHLWHSLIRWLVAGVQLSPSQRLALTPHKVTFTDMETAVADLVIRQEHLGAGVPDVELTGTLLAQPKRITPVPSGDYPGQFRVSFGKLPEGRYRVRVLGTDANEVYAVAAFDVHPGNLAEVLQVEAQPEQMKQIALQSGGAVLETVEPNTLAQLFNDHLSRSRPERTTQTTAWDRWWWLTFAFAIWAAAWGLRRRSGLT